MSGVFRLHAVLHFYFITMKLHLPKGLRTALLAVFAFASSSYADSTTPPPAVYDVMPEIGGPYKIKPDESLYYNSYALDKVVDSSQNWSLTINVDKMYGQPCVGQKDKTGGYSILTNSSAEVYWYTSGGGWNDGINQFMYPGDFAIYVTPNGNVYYAVRGGHVLIAADKQQSSGNTPFSINFSWEVNPDGQTGTLYYVGGEFKEEGYRGDWTDVKFAVLSNVSKDAINDRFATSSAKGPDGANMQVSYTIAAKGISDDFNAWQITGQADLATLLGGGYTDVTSGTPEARALASGEDVWFLGDTGVLYTEENAEITNKLKIQPDFLNFGTTMSYGFGAAEGKTLTVKEAATHSMNSLFGLMTLSSGTIQGVRIVGPGTVEIEMRGSQADYPAGDIIRQVSIDEGTLKLKSVSSGNVTVNVSRGVMHTDAKLVHVGQAAMAVEMDAGTTTVLKSVTNEAATLLTLGTESGQGKLQAETISSKGATQVNADVVATTEFASKGNLTVAGTLQAAGLDADAIVQVEEGATLTTGKADIDGNATISGTMKSVIYTDVAASDGTITIGGKATVNGTLASAGNVTVTEEATIAGSVTMKSATLIAKSVEVTGNGSLAANSVQVTDTANPMVKATGAGVNISIPNTSGVMLLAATPVEVLSGNVQINADGITAGSIADNAHIEFTADSRGEVTTGEVTNASILVGDAASPLASVTGVDYSSTSTSSSVTFSASGIKTGGELAVDEVEIKRDSDFSISARKLTADSMDLGGTEITAASGEQIEMVGVKALSAKEIDAESIKAGHVTLAENYTLRNAKIDAGFTLGKGATLQNVQLLQGMTTNGNFEKMLFELPATMKFTDEGGAYSYVVGGEVTSIELTGAQTGSNFAISGLVIDAENIDFFANNGQPKEVEVLKSNTDEGYNCTMSRAGDYKLQINIQPYVRAEMGYAPTEDAITKITMTGTPDEAGIKAELMNSTNRTGAMTAINEVIDGAAAGSPLAALHDKLGHIYRYSQTEREDLLSAISGASTVALADSQRRGVRDVQNNLRNRIIQMGGGTNAGLTTDWQYAGIQGWAQVDGGLATTSGSGDECGYDFNTTGATVGANLDLTANTVLGMSFSTSYGEIKSDGADSASGNNDTYYLSFFARNQSNRWVQMLILTAGMNQMDLTRNVDGFTGKGETEGMTLSAYYEVGYTFALDYDFNHILQPLVSVSFTSAKLDGYKETGSIGMAGIDYGSSTYTYGQVGLGLRYQGVLYESVHERSAVLEARARVVQDFGDTTDTATIGLLAGGDKFKVKGADTTGTGFEVGVGVSIPIEQHTTLFADADFTYSPDYTGVRANIGLRYDF